MDPLTILSFAQFAAGIGQKIQANRLEQSNPRPTYEIPEAAVESLNMARHMASQTKLPGQTYIEQNMDRNNANTMSFMLDAADNPGKAVENAGKLAAMRNEAQMGLGAQAAQNQQTNQRSLANELKFFAGEQVKQWEWNERQPWEDAMSASSYLNDAGNMNMFLGARGGMQLNYDNINNAFSGEQGANRGKYWGMGDNKVTKSRGNAGNIFLEGYDLDKYNNVV